MNVPYRHLFVLVACLYFAGGCSRGRTAEVSFVKSDGTQVAAFSAEIASTPSQREIGLMYRKEMKNEEAMLFIFPKEEERSFWMKNTYLELDMIFVDSGLKVVSIVERAVPLTESPRRSAGPAVYVLEVRGGRSKALGIQAGMLMKISGELPAAS